MSTLDRNDVQGLAEQHTLAYTFRDVYHFILQALNGDTVAAKAIFERYLAGEISEELLSISRQSVNADQQGVTNPVEKRRITGAGATGGGDAVVVMS